MGTSNIVGTKLLRVDFSNLKLLKFDHRFNCGYPTYTCDRSPESVEHLFLHFQLYANQTRLLIDSLSEEIDNEVYVYPEQHVYPIFFYGGDSFNSLANKMTLE